MTTTLAEKIDNIRQWGGITGRDLAELLDTTPETVSRWVNGKADPHRERLQRLLHLEFFFSELSEFYEPEEARLWLLSPHKLLEGATPADRIREGRTDEIFALLEQLRSGAYA